MRNQKGITLIALVITIIVLLILAGVAIAMLSGDNGILRRASEAGYKTEISTAKEEVANKVNEYITIYYAEVYSEGKATAALKYSSVVDAVNEACKDIKDQYATSSSLTVEYKEAVEEVKDGDNVTTPASPAKIEITYKGDTSKKTTGTIDNSTGKVSWTDAY